MGNCFTKKALKVIIEGRNGPKVYYITNKQLRNIKTYRDFFYELGILIIHFKYMYSRNSISTVEILFLDSDFKIKNLVLCTDTEYHIMIENLYCHQ